MIRAVHNVFIKLCIIFFISITNISFGQTFKDKVPNFSGRYTIGDFWDTSIFYCESDSIKKLVHTYDMYAPGNINYPTNDQVAQTFIFEKQANGMYRIKDEKHNHYLVVDKSTPDQLLNTFHQPAPDDPQSFFELEYDYATYLYKIKVNGKYLHLLNTSKDRLLSTKGLPITTSSDLSYMFSIRKYFDYDYTYTPPEGYDKVIINRVDYTRPGIYGTYNRFLKPATFEEREYDSLGGYALVGEDPSPGGYDYWTNWDWRFEPFYRNGIVYYRIHNLKNNGLHGILHIENGELKVGNPITTFTRGNENIDNSTLWELESVSPTECLPYKKIKNLKTGQYIGAPIFVNGEGEPKPLLGAGDSAEYEWLVLNNKFYNGNGFQSLPTDLELNLAILKDQCNTAVLSNWGAIQMDTENWYSIAALDTPEDYLNWNPDGIATTVKGALPDAAIWKFKEHGFLTYSISSLGGKGLLNLGDLRIHPTDDFHLPTTQFNFKKGSGNVFIDQNEKSWVVTKVVLFDVAAAFDAAKKLNTIQAYEDFKTELQIRNITKLVWFINADWAIAEIKKDPLNYKEFASKYPPAEGIGGNHYDEALWRNAYMINTLDSYNEYITHFPIVIQGDVLDVANPPPGGKYIYTIYGNNIEKAKFRKYILNDNKTASANDISKSFEQYLIEYPEGAYREDLVWEWLDWAWKKAQEENHPATYQWFVDQYNYIHRNYYLDYLKYNDKANIPLRLYGRERVPTSSKVEKLIKEYQYMIFSTLLQIEVLDGANLDLARIHTFIGHDNTWNYGWENFINNATPIYNPPGEFIRSKGETIDPEFDNWGVLAVRNYDSVTTYTTIDESDVPGEVFTTAAQLGAALTGGTYDSNAGYNGGSSFLKLAVKDIPLDTKDGLLKSVTLEFINPMTFGADERVKIKFTYKINKFTSKRFIEHMVNNNLACPMKAPTFEIPTEDQLVSGPGYIIRNETSYPVFVSLSQPVMGPVYYEMVQPGKLFVRQIGELPVTFNINAYLSLNGEEEFNDSDVLLGILQTVGEIGLTVATGGAGGAARGVATGVFEAGLIGTAQQLKAEGAKLGVSAAIKYIAKNGAIEVAKNEIKGSAQTLGQTFYNDLTENGNECLETTKYFSNSFDLPNHKLQVYTITGGPKKFCYDLADNTRTLFTPKPLIISTDQVWQNTVDGMVDGLKLITDQIDELAGIDVSPYANPVYVTEVFQ